MAPLQHWEESILPSPQDIFPPHLFFSASPLTNTQSVLEGWGLPLIGHVPCTRLYSVFQQKIVSVHTIFGREGCFLEYNKKYISVYSSLGYVFKSLEESCYFLLSSVKVLKRSPLSPPRAVSSIHRHGPTLSGPMAVNLHLCLASVTPCRWAGLTLWHPGCLAACPQSHGELDRMSLGKSVKEILAGGRFWRKN